MSLRHPHKRHPSQTPPSVPCSHTRDVTESLLARFYFAASPRKNACPKPRPPASAAPDSVILQKSRPASE